MPPTTRGGAKRPLEESTGNGIGSPAATAPAPPAKKAKKQTTLSFARMDKPAEEQPSPRAMGTTRSATAVAAAVVATSPTEQDEPKEKKQRKASSAAKTPATKTDKKLYDDAVKAVDKTFKALHKKYKPNPNGFYGITSDDFSKAIADQFLPIVQKLSSSGSPLLALNLLLYMADHCYGDLGACIKSSGFGDTDEPFQEMDKAMLSLISSLPVLSTEGFVLQPSKSDFGSEEDEFKNLDSMKKKMKNDMFNKQERRWLDNARINDLHAMFRARHERREKVVSEENGDWAGNALNDLVETRMRIDAYGIGEHYFRESVHKLAELKGVEAPKVFGDE